MGSGMEGVGVRQYSATRAVLQICIPLSSIDRNLCMMGFFRESIQVHMQFSGPFDYLHNIFQSEHKEKYRISFCGRNYFLTSKKHVF